MVLTCPEVSVLSRLRFAILLINLLIFSLQLGLLEASVTLV